MPFMTMNGPFLGDADLIPLWDEGLSKSFNPLMICQVGNALLQIFSDSITPSNDRP